MSVLPGATNTTIHNGNFTAVSTTVANIGTQNDIVALLHSHSATTGLLDARERFDAPKCDEGTRTSMISGMKKFVQDGDASSSPALYWLHGPAGVGKSALAQSLSLLLKSEGDHAASFFFSRTSPGRSNGDQLIVTLAYQLATNCPALQRSLSKVVKKNPAILTASNSVQMQNLIIDPINKWRSSFRWTARQFVYKIINTNKKLHPRLILVDGLDECDDPHVQRDLILCIGSAVRQLSIPLRFVIASRPESHILTTFELDPAFQDLTGPTFSKRNLRDDEDVDEQIRSFLLREFAEIRRVHPIRDFLPRPWPHPRQIEQLVFKSSKGFIYPTTVIRYIKMPNNRPDECLGRILGLSAIPTYDKPYELLDGLYRHIFESVPEINKNSLHKIFHFLVLPSTWDGVTSPTTIERHFNYMPGHVQHVLRDLLCLVAFTRDMRITVLHASLPDFLLDKSRSGPLSINVDNAHTTIAASYLLDICHNDELPSLRSGFADFLEHMMRANMSDTLIQHRIPDMNLVQRYMKVYKRTRIRDDVDRRDIPYTTDIDSQFLEVVYSMWRADDATRPSKSDIEGIAFMVAYLLVLLIRCGPQEYIRSQIVALKACVQHQIYTVTGSVHPTYTRIIPVMTPLFRKWMSTIYNERIKTIFTCEVPPPQNQMREAIFELHLLMMAPLCNRAIICENHLTDVPRVGEREEFERRAKEEPNFWAGIVQGGN